MASNHVGYLDFTFVGLTARPIKRLVRFMSAGSSCGHGNRIQTVEQALEEPPVADHAHQPLLSERHDLDRTVLLVQPVEERDLLSDRQRSDIVKDQCALRGLRQIERPRQLAAVEGSDAQFAELCDHALRTAIDTVDKEVGPTFT